MKKAFFFFIIAGTFISCGQKKRQRTDLEVETPANDFVAEIEQAHNKSKYLQKPGIVYNLQLESKGEKQFSARIWMKPDFSRIRLENDNGTTLIYNGQNVYQTPPEGKHQSARFDIFTWPYFFALPYKLSDPGTIWDIKGTSKLENIEYEAGKLTFEKGSGDAPYDWYMIYTNPFDHKLYCAAYAVPSSKKEEKTNEDLHAIIYNTYKDFNGIPFATEWTFRRWQEKEGLRDQLMKGQISNLNFVHMDESLFDIPENSKLVEKP